MTGAEVARLLDVIDSLWPGARRTVAADSAEAQVVVWAAVMIDVGIEEAEQVCVTIARTGARFPPAAGEIVAAVAEERARAAGLAAPSADEAWAEVQGAVHARGWQAGPPEWTHPAVRQAARAIGWNELCRGSEMANRAHFLKLYAERRTIFISEQTRLSLDAPTNRALGAGPQ